jgi:2-polyprenyl-3-methyl-5-hydroxy-6-metoxy-1,4-benzoquinol methylase
VSSSCLPNKVPGSIEGEAIRAIAQAKADAYRLGVEAIGSNYGLLQIFSALAEKNIRLTPDVLVAGGGNSATASSLWCSATCSTATGRKRHSRQPSCSCSYSDGIHYGSRRSPCPEPAKNVALRYDARQENNLMSTPQNLPAINEAKLNEFLGRAVGDLGAAMHAVLVLLGDRIGLYKAMADSKPVTSAELAQRTGVRERYVREWLNANAASGYVTYDPAAETYTLPPEQAFALAVENSPAFLPGAFQLISSCFHDAVKTEEAFRTGRGVGWHEHHHDLFHGTERFFRPNYIANLTSSWIPALTGVEEKLKKGAKVADIGCGLGTSTILMAKEYPNSEFYGFDYHEGSIQLARASAERQGVAGRIRFEVASAKAFPGKDYDFVAFFDCLHDMGDPVGVASYVRSAMKPDGNWMIVEPFAEDATEANHNPLGRLMYSASTLLCVPASLSQEVGAALGAQAGERRLRSVLTSGGFSQFRRATQTPFNLVFEARP